MQRVVVLKDQANKKAHKDSAQLACEAAGSIRTVASLTREDDCLRLYSKSLEEPLRKSNRTAIWSNLLYSFTQAQVFFVIALVFWWGATLVSRLEATTFQFFVGLMVCLFLFEPSPLDMSTVSLPRLVQFKLAMFSLLYLTCPPLKAPPLISSRYWTPSLKSMPNLQGAKLLIQRPSGVTSSLKISTSDILPVPGSVFCVTSHSKLNLAPMLPWLAPPVQERAQRELMPKTFPSHWY